MAIQQKRMDQMMVKIRERTQKMVEADEEKRQRSERCALEESPVTRL